MWCSSPKKFVWESWFWEALAIISKPQLRNPNHWLAETRLQLLDFVLGLVESVTSAIGGRGLLGLWNLFFVCCIWVVRHLKIFIQSLVHIKRSITSFTLMSASLRVSSKSLRGTTFEWDSSSANHHVMKAEIVESEPWSKKVLLKNGRSSHLLHHLFGQHLIPSKVIPTPPKFNIEPENGGFPIGISPVWGLHFQVPCYFSGA